MNMTKTYAVSNHKGGVGKTTSTVNIGAALVSKGKRVLLIDLDPQANLTQSLGIKESENNIYEILKGEKDPVPIEVRKNLFVIPSSLDLSAAENELSSEPGREYILKDIISKVPGEYDYIFIDCPPSLGLLTINALTCAEKVLIPLTAEFLPLKGVAKLNEVIQKIKGRLNSSLDIGGVFLTRFDPRKVLNRDVATSLMDFFKEKFVDSPISNNISLAEAPSQGQDIFLYNRKSKGAVDYMNLCEKMLESRIL